MGSCIPRRIQGGRLAESTTRILKEPNKLTLPVLALGGEFAERDKVLESMQQLAHDVHGAIVAGSGHYILEERPDRLVELLLDYFARCYVNKKTR